MGYEIKMLIGRACDVKKELVLDLDHPCDDGSGYPNKLDDEGHSIPTGRLVRYIMPYAEIDLGKVANRDTALTDLVENSHREKPSEAVCYFYGSDGNTEIIEDRYGATMLPVPIKDVIRAMSESYTPGAYRRIDWALALLKSMVDSGNFDLSVVFYGH